MRRLLLALLLVASALAFGACKTGVAKKPDPSALEACKTTAKDSESCKVCCFNAGGTGHLFMSGASGGCKCL